MSTPKNLRALKKIFEKADGLGSRRIHNNENFPFEPICFFFQAFNQASYVGVGIGNKTNAINQKNQVAVNIGQASEEDLKLHTFAQLAPPAAAGASENPSSFAPSETFARLGIRSSKDGKAFDLDRQLQIANASSSEINLRKTIY